MKITIECNEEQADLMVAALEDYFRLRMGQADHMARSLADDTFKWDESNPENERLFDKYIERKENLNYVYQSLIKMAYGNGLKNSDTCRNVCDIWRSLYRAIDGDERNLQLRGYKLIQLGTIDLPKIEVER